MGSRLAWINLLTAAGVVITSSSEATGYVDDALANPARWNKWRSATGTGDQWVKFDLGSNKNFRLLAAMNAVLHSGGTLKAQAHATDAWGAPTVNDTLTVPATNFTSVLTDWLGSTQNLRWVRFYFTNTGAVNAYVELGSVFAGAYLEPARSISDGLSIRRVDPSIQRVATGGQRSSVIKPKYHEVSATLELQTATARDDLRALYETTGATASALLALDPADPSLIFYGTFRSTLAVTDRGPDLWDVPIEFTEDVAS